MAGEGRISQAVTDALVTAVSPSTRISHTPAEVLVTGLPPARLSQDVLEVLVVEQQPGRFSQFVLEAVVPYVPPPTAWREYAAFLTFTIEGTTYRWGTVAAYRKGGWYEGIVADWPRPTDAFRDDFGVVAEDRFSVEVADPDGQFIGLIDSLRGVNVDVELVTTRYRIDGNTFIETYSRKATIDAPTRLPGQFSLELVDLDRTFMESEYPNKRFNTTDFPELYTDDVGKPVPVVVGTALKVPFVYAVNNAGLGPWVYYGPENLGSPSVLTVYRDGRIVGASEYTAGTATVGGTTYLTLTFTQEQVDFQGNQMAITADLQSTLSRNAATELNRILTVAGVSTGSFSPAYADTEKQYVDIGYVQPRTIQAIVQDLLLVLRGHLHRLPSGQWSLIQDQPQEVVLAWDEDARDEVEVLSYTKRRRSKTVELEYHPRSSQDLLELKHVIRRDTGSSTGTKRFVAPYVRDHEAADRLLSYLEAKERTAAEARATIHDVQLPLGGVIRLRNSLLYSGDKDFLVPRVTRSEDRNDLDLGEYVASVYTYVAGTLPPDATSGYQPDYSQTPPDPPTDLAIVSNTAISNGSIYTATVVVKATPPSVNWETLWFSITRTDTGEIFTQQGTDNGDGTYGATFAGLAASKAHELRAWAVNAYGIDGAVAGPLAFTTAGPAAPNAPGSITAAQGPGKSIRVTWSAVSGTSIRYYELQRNGITITKADTLEFVDQGVSYGVAYTYQVRAEDAYDNASAYTAASPITIAKNIAQPDLTDGSVGSPQLIDLNVTNPKVGDSAISTGKIQVEAVTVRAHATAGGSVTVSSSTWTDLISLAFDSAGYAASILFTAFGFVPEQSNNEGRILRNGVDITGNIKLYEVRIGSSGDVGATASIVFRDASPPTGSNTYTIQAREVEYAGLGTTYSNRSIILDTAKV